jgi:HK97 family phage prohead protease
VRDANGKPDPAHIRNALARISQSTIPDAAKVAAMAEAKKMAAAHAGIGSGSTDTYQGDAGSGRSVVPSEPGLLLRSFDVELRAEGDGRTVIGLAVPYGETADIGGGKTERFTPGAFARQIAGGQLHTVKLHGSHSQRMAGEFPIGKTVSLNERSDGLLGAWTMYETPRGDEALHLVKTGEVTGMSVGFQAIAGGTTLGADGALVRNVAHLDHVILTTSPIYAGAQVMAVRDQSTPPRRDDQTFALRSRALLDRINAPS